jgi:hypothetical protein
MQKKFGGGEGGRGAKRRFCGEGAGSGVGQIEGYCREKLMSAAKKQAGSAAEEGQPKAVFTNTPCPRGEEKVTIPNTSFWLLRRLAARCIRVHARQKGKAAGLGVFDSTLPGYCGTYMERYDALRQLAKRRMKERREGKLSIKNLLYTLRIWAPIVARDIEEVRAGEFGENESVPDDVIRDTKAILKYAIEHRDMAGEPLPYLDTLVADITPVLEAAEKEWGEAEEAQEDYSDMRNALHEVGVKLEKDLIAYRKSLRTVVGRGHHDYQKLRVDRARAPDEDDDEVAAALPEDLPEEAEGTPVVPDTQATDEAQATP